MRLGPRDVVGMCSAQTQWARGLLHFGEAGQSPLVKPLWPNDSPCVAVSELMSYRGDPETWTHSQPNRKGAEPGQPQNSDKLCLQPLPSPPGSQGAHAVSTSLWKDCCKPALVCVEDPSSLPLAWGLRFLRPDMMCGAPLPCSHPLEEMNKPGSSGLIAVDVITQL